MSAPPGGVAEERTALAWWRTAQTAIACALLIAKLGTDRTVLGWVSTGLAIIIAVVAWLGARVRAREDDDPTRAPASLRREIVAVGGLGALLAIGVLAGVVIAT